MYILNLFYLLYSYNPSFLICLWSPPPPGWKPCLDQWSSKKCLKSHKKNGAGSGSGRKKGRDGGIEKKKKRESGIWEPLLWTLCLYNMYYATMKLINLFLIFYSTDLLRTGTNTCVKLPNPEQYFL